MQNNVSIERISSLLNKKFSLFGINKQRELLCLIYEIACMEKSDPADIIENLPDKDFLYLKEQLVKRRFPVNYKNLKKEDIYLPDLMSVKEKEFYRSSRNFPLPKHVFFDKASENSEVLKNLQQKYPGSEFMEISSFRDFIKEFKISSYSERSENLFVLEQSYDFFKRCPCTAGCINCGYSVMNLAFGCPYECTYCFLQEYNNIPGIVLPGNPGEYMERLKAYSPFTERIGSGEFSDSLVYDHVTSYSSYICDLMNEYPDNIFEFKTKSDNISCLLDCRLQPNIVVSWSVNPQTVIDENEIYTSSLKERLEAASECAEYGYRIGFHFDPVIYYDSWENDYKQVVDKLFEEVNISKLAWISIGTLRFSRKLKPVIYKRFPCAEILSQEMMSGFDRKIRYPENVRVDIYSKMNLWIKKYSQELPVYLCMEDLNIWNSAGMEPSFNWKHNFSAP